MNSLRILTLARVVSLAFVVSVSVAQVAVGENLSINTPSASDIEINAPYDNVTVKPNISAIVVNNSFVGQRSTTNENGLNVFEFDGTLTQSSGSFTNNGYVANAMLSGMVSFTNNTSGNPKVPGELGMGGVDRMVIGGNSPFVDVINNGSIGVYSTEINERDGGLTQAGGSVTNNNYISILNISGGQLMNNKKVTVVEQTGGSVTNKDWMVSVTVNGESAYFYNAPGGGISNDNGFGGNLDLISGTVINNNFIERINMSGGTLMHNLDRKGRATKGATITGGELFGDGRFGTLEIGRGFVSGAEDDFVLDTNAYTGTITDLIVNVGSSIQMEIRKLAESNFEFDILHIENSLVMETGCYIEIAYDGYLSELGFGDEDDLKDFVLAEMFDFGNGTTFSFNGGDLSDNIWEYVSFRYFVEEGINAFGIEDPVSNPEPATVLFLAVSALAGLPISRRFRKKS